MRYRQGFFRIWIVFFILWDLGFYSIGYLQTCLFPSVFVSGEVLNIPFWTKKENVLAIIKAHIEHNPMSELQFDFDDCHKEKMTTDQCAQKKAMDFVKDASKSLYALIMVFLVIPAIPLFFGMAISWILSGFRSG